MGTSVHADKTRGDDNAIIILEFENGVTGLAEESWTKLGGMDDRAESPRLRGRGLCRPAARQFDRDLQRARRTTMRSKRPARTVGWSFMIYEETWNYGFPQEMQHFVDVRQE